MAFSLGLIRNLNLISTIIWSIKVKYWFVFVDMSNNALKDKRYFELNFFSVLLFNVYMLLLSYQGWIDLFWSWAYLIEQLITWLGDPSRTSWDSWTRKSCAMDTSWKMRMRKNNSHKNMPFWVVNTSLLEPFPHEW